MSKAKPVEKTVDLPPLYSLAISRAWEIVEDRAQFQPEVMKNEDFNCLHTYLMENEGAVNGDGGSTCTSDPTHDLTFATDMLNYFWRAVHCLDVGERAELHGLLTLQIAILSTIQEPR